MGKEGSDMIAAVTSIVLGLCFFIVPVWMYRLGLKDGLALNQGAKTIKPIRSPVQVMEGRREKEPEPDTFVDSLLKGHANMMSFTGDIEEKR